MLTCLPNTNVSGIQILLSLYHAVKPSNRRTQYSSSIAGVVHTLMLIDTNPRSSTFGTVVDRRM